LEKAALVVVFSARRLRHYFHSFTVVVMTNLPIQKVLQKPDVAGRMVAGRWSCPSLIFSTSLGDPSKGKSTQNSHQEAPKRWS